MVVVLVTTARDKGSRVIDPPPVGAGEGRQFHARRREVVQLLRNPPEAQRGGGGRFEGGADVFIVLAFCACCFLALVCLFEGLPAFVSFRWTLSKPVILERGQPADKGRDALVLENWNLFVRRC